MNDISKVVEQMIKELEADHYGKSDRLQKILEELVKIEVAKIESARL